MSISDHVLSIEESMQDDFGYVEPSLTDPAIAIPRMISSIVADLDELMVATREPDKADFIAADAPAFGQMIVRCQLILSMLEARKAPALKVVGGSR